MARVVKAAAPSLSGPIQVERTPVTIPADLNDLETALPAGTQPVGEAWTALYGPGPIYSTAHVVGGAWQPMSSTAPTGSVIDKTPTPGPVPADLTALAAAVDPSTQPADESWRSLYGTAPDYQTAAIIGGVWVPADTDTTAGEVFDGVIHREVVDTTDVSGLTFATIDWSNAVTNVVADGAPLIGSGVDKASAGVFNGQPFDARARVVAAGDSNGSNDWLTTDIDVLVDREQTGILGGHADTGLHVIVNQKISAATNASFNGARICAVVEIEIFAAGTTDPMAINTYQLIADLDKGGPFTESAGFDTTPVGIATSTPTDLIEVPADAFVAGLFPTGTGTVYEATDDDPGSAGADPGNKVAGMIVGAAKWRLLLCKRQDTNTVVQSGQYIQSVPDPALTPTPAPGNKTVSYFRYITPSGTIYRDEMGALVTPDLNNTADGLPGTATTTAQPIDGVVIDKTPTAVPADLTALTTAVPPGAAPTTENWVAKVGNAPEQVARLTPDRTAWYVPTTTTPDTWIDIPADQAGLSVNRSHNLDTGQSVAAPAVAAGGWFSARAVGGTATITGVTDGALAADGTVGYWVEQGGAWERLPAPAAATPSDRYQEALDALAVAAITGLVEGDEVKQLDTGDVYTYDGAALQLTGKTITADPNYQPATAYAINDIVISAIPVGSANGAAGTLSRYQRTAAGLSGGGAPAAMDLAEETSGNWSYLGAAADLYSTLGDVDTTGIQVGDSMFWDGTTWRPGQSQRFWGSVDTFTDVLALAGATAGDEVYQEDDQKMLVLRSPDGVIPADPTNGGHWFVTGEQLNPKTWDATTATFDDTSFTFDVA